MIPFFDLGRTHAELEPDLTAAFQRVLRGGQFIGGSEVGTFERSWADWLGLPHAVGLSSGTDALLAALMALEVGPGDEVIVPTFTFFATAGAVARLGATPVFADVDPDTFLIDVADALGQVTERTRAVIVVHLYGQCAAVEPFQAAGLPVIEDVAQAHGARDASGRMAGTRGELACFSFFPTKPLGAFGDAGAVAGADAELIDAVRLVRTHGARPKFHHLRIGGNFRLDALQAALMAVKLPHVHRWADERRTIAAGYRGRLAGLATTGAVRFLHELEGRHVYHQHVVRAQRRDALRAALRAAGIGTALYYPEPLHIQPCFTAPGPLRPLPHAELACTEAVALPCFPGLTPTELDTICHAIGGFYAS